MKTLNFSEIKEKLRPWALRNLPEKDWQWIDDDELVDKCNIVARRLNSKAELRQERYNNNTTSGETNYEMAGDILEVYLFLYKDASTYKDQRYTWVGDVIVLKEEPDGEIEMDIRYLRDIEEITNSNLDEVDLPPEGLDGFLQLLKKKWLLDIGVIHEDEFERELMRVAAEVQERMPRLGIRDTRIFRHTRGLMTDDTLYDITDHRLSQDSVTVDVDGDYIFL